MSSQSLATKYRPQTWEDLTEQDFIKIILENQIKTKTVKNAYLFCGPAGCGKTTSARIFANKINDNKGQPIEVDAASNNGVDQIRTIIEDAKFKSLDSEYKIYILDEVHMLSIGAWNAMLKLLEEPPKTTIFILCTTDPQKIPKTILSRVQRYDFHKISLSGSTKRLEYILQEEMKVTNINESITYDKEALNYISKVSDGGMRDAISMLDKCLSYSKTINIENVINALGISDYDNLDKLFMSILNKNRKECIEIIEKIYNDGKDLKQFIKQEVQFILDVIKYLIYESYNYIQIPSTIDLSKYKQFDKYLLLDNLDGFMNINNKIKYDSNPKTWIESSILLMIM